MAARWSGESGTGEREQLDGKRARTLLLLCTLLPQLGFRTLLGKRLEGR